LSDRLRPKGSPYRRTLSPIEDWRLEQPTDSIRPTSVHRSTQQTPPASPPHGLESRAFGEQRRAIGVASATPTPFTWSSGHSHGHRRTAARDWRCASPSYSHGHGLAVRRDRARRFAQISWTPRPLSDSAAVQASSRGRPTETHHHHFRLTQLPYGEWSSPSRVGLAAVSRPLSHPTHFTFTTFTTHQRFGRATCDITRQLPNSDPQSPHLYKLLPTPIIGADLYLGRVAPTIARD
jgi:hypothetical protein